MNEQQEIERLSKLAARDREIAKRWPAGDPLRRWYNAVARQNERRVQELTTFEQARAS